MDIHHHQITDGHGDPFMMDRKSIDAIKNLYFNQVEGTETLYSDVGYFIRTQLWRVVQVLKWDEAVVLCEQKKQEGYVMADKCYTEMLSVIQTYISEKQGSEDCLIMIDNLNMIKRKFKGDAVAFVQAMADCLRKEKEILFYNKKHLEEEETTMEDEPVRQSFQMTETMRGLAKKALMIKDKFDNAGVSRNRPTEISAGIMDGKNTSPQLEMSYNNHYTQPEEVQNMLLELLRDLEKCVEQLKPMAAELRRMKALASIKCLAAYDTAPYHIFAEVAKVLDTLSSLWPRSLDDSTEELGALQCTWLSQSHNHFKAILKEFIESAVIEDKHPQACVSVNKEESQGSGKKYGVKKKESINTVLHILGGDHFQNIEILSTHVELIAEKHIQSQGAGQDAKCFGFLNPQPTAEHKDNKIFFNNVRIKGYARSQNDAVYEQFLRLKYHITICVNKCYSHNVSTLSLPFLVSTGAIQNLELIGSHMWYIANSEDLYNGDFKIPENVPVEKVLDMLDMRMPSLDGKKRHLSQQARALLKSKFSEISSDDTVSLRSFIKTKDKVKRTNSEAIQGTDSFAFFTWFYALVNTIETRLLKAWTDGIVYDLLTYEDAKKILLDKDIPEKTVLIRPQLSKVLVPNSVDAYLRMIVEIKVKEHGKYEVAPVPFDIMKDNNNTLYHSVSSIVSEGKSLVRFICTKDSNDRIDILRNYPLKEPHIDAYHNILIQRMTTLTLLPADSLESNFHAIKEEADSPKIKRQRSCSSTASGSSTLKIAVDDAEMGCLSNAKESIQGEPDVLPAMASHQRHDSKSYAAIIYSKSVDQTQNQEPAKTTRYKTRQAQVTERSKSKIPNSDRIGLKASSNLPGMKIVDKEINRNFHCGGIVRQPSSEMLSNNHMIRSEIQHHPHLHQNTEVAWLRESGNNNGAAMSPNNAQRAETNSDFQKTQLLVRSANMAINPVKVENVDGENGHGNDNAETWSHQNTAGIVNDQVHEESLMDAEFLAKFVCDGSTGLTELSPEDINSLSDDTLSPSDSGFQADFNGSP